MAPPDRRKRRHVLVGDVAVGGGAPVSVQSMTRTDLGDAKGTIAEIARLAEAGCEIIRVAYARHDMAASLAEVCRESPLPVVADVHFDWRLAKEAVESGCHKLRINPGNMDVSAELSGDVARLLVDRGVPVRVGVNSGSVRARGKEAGADERSMADALVETALEGCRLMEEMGVGDIVVSMKAPDVATTVAAYRRVAGECDYPLHVGVTAAGPPDIAATKSAIGIGALLLEGIGDTLRVSYTGAPIEEIEAGHAILEALDIRRRGPEIISCPTCGRTKVDLPRIVAQVRTRLAGYPSWLKVAVMGCVVNGPGEAAEADVGLASNPDSAAVFRSGERVRRVSEAEAVDALMAEVDAFVDGRGEEGGE